MAVNSEDVKKTFELLGAKPESLSSSETMLAVRRGPSGRSSDLSVTTCCRTDFETAKQVLRPVRLVQTLQSIATFAPA